MTKKEPPDSHKNPGLKRTEVVEYLVTPDQDGQRWTVSREHQPTGAFARDKSTAVGLAYREASREMAETGHKISVWSVQGGKRTKEWPN
jgi:hypothetical protein